MKKELFGESLAPCSERRISCVNLNSWTCQAKSSFIDIRHLLRLLINVMKLYYY